MMMEIEAIKTENPNYSFSVDLPNGEEYKFHIYYLARTGYWIMDLQYKDVKSNGRRIVANNNLFHDKKNVLPYAIMIMTTNGVDPTGQDFWTIDDNNTMYIADYDEIQ